VSPRTRRTKFSKEKSESTLKGVEKEGRGTRKRELEEKKGLAGASFVSRGENPYEEHGKRNSKPHKEEKGKRAVGALIEGKRTSGVLLGPEGLKQGGRNQILGNMGKVADIRAFEKTEKRTNTGLEKKRPSSRQGTDGG